MNEKKEIQRPAMCGPSTLVAIACLIGVASGGTAAQDQGPSQARRAATKLLDEERAAAKARSLDELAFPHLAKSMLRWPEDKLLTGPQRVHGGDWRVAAARAQSAKWTRKLLRKDWLPADPKRLGEDTIPIRDEYGRLDATHVRWETSGHAIQVSQTRGTMVVKLTPLRAVEVPETLEDKKEYARDLCLKVLVETTHKGMPGEGNPPIRVRPVILDRSFSRGTVRDLPGGVVAGAPWKPMRDLEYQKSIRSDNGILRVPGSALTYCWWAQLGWFTNGKDVGLWTHKLDDNGAELRTDILMGYFNDPHGESWF